MSNTDSKRWEYKVIPAELSFWGQSKPQHMNEVLNREGLQGWELVSVVRHGMNLDLFLKRPR